MQSFHKINQIFFNISIVSTAILSKRSIKFVITVKSNLMIK